MLLFWQIYLLLFVASSPVAYVMMYIAMTPQLSQQQRWQFAKKACYISLFILLVIGILGQSFLTLLGVKLGAFRIAGGLIIGLIGLDMLQHNLETTSKTFSEEHVVVPLAFPMISGPGAISAIMIAKTSVHTFIDKIHFFSAIISIILTFYGFFYLAIKFSTKISSNIVTIIYKISGIILVLLSIEFIHKGIIKI